MRLPTRARLESFASLLTKPPNFLGEVTVDNLTIFHSLLKSPPPFPSPPPNTTFGDPIFIITKTLGQMVDLRGVDGHDRCH